MKVFIRQPDLLKATRKFVRGEKEREMYAQKVRKQTSIVYLFALLYGKKT